jgi:hypothetical protein
MRWDEEEQNPVLPIKGWRPVAETIIGPECRFRHPAEQAEVERRVAIYARQVEELGVLTWLPRKGEG